MEQHESQENSVFPPPQDISALPPLFFEPEVDSEQNSEENTPPNSTLIPCPANRNEAKLSLSSYQSVTSGDITPTRNVTPVSFQDSGLNDVSSKRATSANDQTNYNLNSPEIVSKQPDIGNNCISSIRKTSTPMRPDMETSQQSSEMISSTTSTKEKSRSGNRVSFQKTDVIEPFDVRVPITGFEVMEPRTRFTVFKLHVHKGDHDNWFVFRRYTDFVLLQRKLSILFPTFRFALPPKRWFLDNFDKTFLEDRQLGLQAFIDSVLCHKNVCNSQPVQEFFCFNDPPGPLDSLEEGRAFCESLEDAIYALKKEMKQKDGELELLKEELSLYKSQVEMLSKALREKNENGARKAVLSPANSMAECDHLAPEADQSQGKMSVKAEIHQSENRIENASQPLPRKQSPVSQRNITNSKPLAHVTF